jgi:glycerol-3-phosphate acyltransferase PlsY
VSRPRTATATAAVVGYLLGTVPSADLAARAASGGAVDLRAAGSGNPGAANAIKVLGKRWGYGVMAADIAKAAAASGIGRRVAGSRGAHVAGTAAVVGHCFPVWNGFRGGKGVACSVGQCLVTFPAYFPVDLGVAALTSTRRWRSRSYAATVAASVAWVLGALLWWRKGWRNGWGPAPDRDLVLAAAASSAVILTRFASATTPPTAPPPPSTAAR